MYSPFLTAKYNNEKIGERTHPYFFLLHCFDYIFLSFFSINLTFGYILSFPFLYIKYETCVLQASAENFIGGPLSWIKVLVYSDKNLYGLLCNSFHVKGYRFGMHNSRFHLKIMRVLVDKHTAIIWSEVFNFDTH